MMKKIGFIDFFLDEWHANNFPTWIRDNCQAVGRDMELAYAWAETAAPGGIDTAAWCAKYQVQTFLHLKKWSKNLITWSSFPPIIPSTTRGWQSSR
jgi:hypothetical protein